jgi:hypothetical protein
MRVCEGILTIRERAFEDMATTKRVSQVGRCRQPNTDCAGGVQVVGFLTFRDQKISPLAGTLRLTSALGDDTIDRQEDMHSLERKLKSSARVSHCIE